MMVIPKANIKAVYTYLLTEGVVVVKKDARLPKHPDMSVSNLEVMNIMKSLQSRGYVSEEFNWQHHYYYLNDEGIAFLRNYLHVPESVVPLTVAKAQQAAATRSSAPTDVRRSGRRN